MPTSRNILIVYPQKLWCIPTAAADTLETQRMLYTRPLERWP